MQYLHCNRERRAEHGGLDVTELVHPRFPSNDSEPKLSEPEPPKPIGAGNVGYKLLLQMGWTAGTGLGRERQGPVDPIAVVHKKDRRGVGTTTHTTARH